MITCVARRCRGEKIILVRTRTRLFSVQLNCTPSKTHVFEKPGYFYNAYCRAERYRNKFRRILRSPCIYNVAYTPGICVCTYACIYGIRRNILAPIFIFFSPLGFLSNQCTVEKPWARKPGGSRATYVTGLTNDRTTSGPRGDGSAHYEVRASRRRRWRTRAVRLFRKTSTFDESDRAPVVAPRTRAVVDHIITLRGGTVILYSLSRTRRVKKKNIEGYDRRRLSRRNVVKSGRTKTRHSVRRPKYINLTKVHFGSVENFRFCYVFVVLLWYFSLFPNAEK